MKNGEANRDLVLAELSEAQVYGQGVVRGTQALAN